MKEQPDVNISHAFVIVDREERRHALFTEAVNTSRLTLESLLTMDDIRTAQLERKSLAERGKLATNPITKKLFDIAHRKQTRVIVAIDTPDPSEVLELIDQVGKNVCCVKLHFDAIDFSRVEFDVDEFFRRMNEFRHRDEWLLFEDRKYLDIAKTVELQHANTRYIYGGSLDLVTSFTIASEHTIEGIAKAEKLNPDNQLGVLLIAELSTKGNIVPSENYDRCMALSQSNNIVAGVICQARHGDTPDNIAYITPGVRINTTSDKSDQQYRTPTEAIERDRCDFIVVGRGICESHSPFVTSTIYKTMSWC
jgi:orotidine 5'-phosphate decarboxylase subfamily 1